MGTRLGVVYTMEGILPVYIDQQLLNFCANDARHSVMIIAELIVFKHRVTRAKSNASECENCALPCTVTRILHSTTLTQMLAHCCTNARNESRCVSR